MIKVPDNLKIYSIIWVAGDNSELAEGRDVKDVLQAACNVVNIRESRGTCHWETGDAISILEKMLLKAGCVEDIKE